MSHINRRTLVAGIAGALPVAAVGAVTPFTMLADPAFATIDAHRHAWAGLNEIYKIPEDDPRFREVERGALDKVSAAEDQFVFNQPTTILGVAALLR